VLVVPPPLNEAMRAHFALRQVAIRLAQAGADVLRFDYSGCGNSLGDSSDFRVADWESDIAAAALELREVSGAPAVDLVAVRFSACLAARALDGQLRRTVFWDPLLSGEAWLECLRRSQDKAARRLPGTPLDRDREFMGHRMHERFAVDVGAIGHCTPPGRDLLQIVHASLPGGAGSGESNGMTSPVEHMAFECDWESLSSQVLFPHAVIARISEFLS